MRSLHRSSVLRALVISSLRSAVCTIALYHRGPLGSRHQDTNTAHNQINLFCKGLLKSIDQCNRRTETPNPPSPSTIIPSAIPQIHLFAALNLTPRKATCPISTRIRRHLILSTVAAPRTEGRSSVPVAEFTDSDIFGH